MKNLQQANNNNLSDPAVANDPRAQFEDIPIPGEQEERIKGGATLAALKPAEASVYDWPGDYAQRFDGGNKIP